MLDVHKKFDEFYTTQKKIYGNGVAFLPRLKHALAEVEFVASEIPEVDKALGGGIPVGRMIEIFGMESSGKTSFSLHMASKFQKKYQDKLVAFIDAENSLDIYQAEHTFGVNIENMPISQLDAGEDSLSYVEQCCKSGLFSLIIVDSIDSLNPRSAIEGEIGDSNMGRKGKMMSDAMRLIPPAAKKTNTTIIWINQIRVKVGVVFGNPEYTSGGNALKFYASQRIDMRKKDFLKRKENGVESLCGIKSKFKVVKNKVGMPFQECFPDLIWNVGFDAVGGRFRALVENETINKSGSWFSYNGERIGQGETKAMDWFKENLDKFEEKK